MESLSEKQKGNYNAMLKCLKLIGKGYKTAEQLQRQSEKLYGLEYHEALEMSYDNIRGEARYIIQTLNLRELK